MGSKKRNDLGEAKKKSGEDDSREKGQKENIFFSYGIKHFQIVAALISVIFQSSDCPSVFEGSFIK
jgi:hypothetical protein